MRGRIGAVCLLVLAGLGCTGEQVTFDALRGADRIEVLTSHAEVVSTIEDPATIAAVQAMISRHDLGWSAPWLGTPVPPLQVNFHRGRRLLGGFGLGEGFLTSDPGPTFMMRSIPATETQEIARLLGVALEAR